MADSVEIAQHIFRNSVAKSTVENYKGRLTQARLPYCIASRAETGAYEPEREPLKATLSLFTPISPQCVSKWHVEKLNSWVVQGLHSRIPGFSAYSVEDICIAIDTILDVYIISEAKADCALECVKIGFHAIKKHVGVLASKRRRLATPDEYGRIDRGAWVQEMRYFVDNIVAAECGALWEHSHIFKDMGVDMVFDNLSKAIEAACDEEFQSKALPVATPRDFEAHCADVLNCLGWVASLTRASGDQGVDVIARKGNVSLAVQCKLYSGPVGNKAVQEVAAGRKHYSVDYAIVVSDAGFTASARALATTNNVLLLSTADFTLFATEIAEE